MDFHGTPKHSEWSEKRLEELMETEVTAYDKLKKLQGDVVPEFIFRGSDFNFLWVTVTTYAGEAFDLLLDKNKEVSKNMIREAVKGLKLIHGKGVLHGDIAFRNIVFLDGHVKWIDFEFAKFRKDFKDKEEFKNLAKAEIATLLKLFERVPKASLNDSVSNIETTKLQDNDLSSTFNAPSSKRTKVIPCCM